eukprot:CAMPEP_0119403018 /NCGR_PEP_ID=MMETSP1334-20130426/143174_1 /TAXON_ID=127549 /ORGANISM="Calcidiscus leptoporus, Strain RCC1130" /LENGTH=187 /DNA_ID=CAMNT_0007426957 /DNA_START=165 /DNA_END=728 /DNA_ORIENTATION=+
MSTVSKAAHSYLLSAENARIVFLDIDGVLHPTLLASQQRHTLRQRQEFCQDLDLPPILDVTPSNALGSRGGEIIDWLVSLDLPPILDVTPSNALGSRGGEIIDWLVSATSQQNLSMPQWVVLDDQALPDLAATGASKHHVRPSPAQGLTEQDVQVAIQQLMEPCSNKPEFRYHHNRLLRVFWRLWGL